METEDIKEEIAITLLPATKEEVEPQFPIIRKELQDLAISLASLTIADVNDKEGMKAVDAGRKTLKRKIALIRSTGKMTRDGANKYAKAVIELENSLVDELEPTKELLEGRYDVIEAERERLREEEQRREDERIQDMLNLLRNVGADMDIYELKAITPERFELVLAESTESFERKKIEDEERRVQDEKEEAERQRIAEQKAAADREELRQLREKQEKERKELEEQIRIQTMASEKLHEQARQLEIEKAKMEAEKAVMAKDKLDLRIKRLADIGFTWTGFSAIYKKGESSAKINADQIHLATTDPEFEKVINLSIEIKAHIDKEEEDRLQLEAQRREKELIEAERQRAESEAKAKEEARLKAEADQKERLANSEDSDRFAFLAQQIDVSFLRSTVWGHMQSQKGKEVANNVKELLKNAFDICKENERKQPTA